MQKVKIFADEMNASAAGLMENTFLRNLVMMVNIQEHSKKINASRKKEEEKRREEKKSLKKEKEETEKKRRTKEKEEKKEEEEQEEGGEGIPKQKDVEERKKKELEEEKDPAREENEEEQDQSKIKKVKVHLGPRENMKKLGPRFEMFTMAVIGLLAYECLHHESQLSVNEKVEILEALGNRDGGTPLTGESRKLVTDILSGKKGYQRSNKEHYYVFGGNIFVTKRVMQDVYVGDVTERARQYVQVAFVHTNVYNVSVGFHLEVVFEEPERDSEFVLGQGGVDAYDSEESSNSVESGKLLILQVVVCCSYIDYVIASFDHHKSSNCYLKFLRRNGSFFFSVFVCFFLCLFVCFCLFLSFFLCFFLCFFVSFFLSFFVSFFVSLFLCFFLSFFVSLFLSFFVSFFVCLFLSLFLCFFLSFFVSLFLFLFLSLFLVCVCLSLSVCICI